MKHAATLETVAGPPAGRELDDHSRAVLPDAGLDLREAFRIRGWRLVVVPHMDMNEGGARFESGVGGFDLLGDADWDRRIVLLAGD
jgi:hypothetical protein